MRCSSSRPTSTGTPGAALVELREVALHPLEGCEVGPASRRFALDQDMAELHFPSAREDGGDTLVAVVAASRPGAPFASVRAYGTDGDEPLRIFRIANGSYQIPATRGPGGALAYIPIATGAADGPVWLSWNGTAYEPHAAER